MAALLLNYRQTESAAQWLIVQNLCQLINLFCITESGHGHECITRVCRPYVSQMYWLE